ncbi:centromere protein F isoform X1 [Gouania willdenowi]|uniref:Centromere protein F-like n=1 Tax=Gouania willdenowi TaxID=441366 RepID=A0A8C5E2I0_GOUWI|nr:centromere protein F-like isoform X1 [Gouania willdenowi]
MSWAEEDWTVGLSGRVLQKVKELQVHQERLSRENKQKQLQLDNIHISLGKQTAKYEEVRVELQSVQRELQFVQEEAKTAFNSKERLSQEVQTKQAQVCSLEGQLDAARAHNNKLTQEIKRLEAELEKLQNSRVVADTTLYSTPCWNPSSYREHHGIRQEESSLQRDGQNRTHHSRQRLQFSDVATPSLPRQPSTPYAAFPWEQDESTPIAKRRLPLSPQMQPHDVTHQELRVQGDCGIDGRREADEMRSRVSALEAELSEKATTLKCVQTEQVQSKKELAAKELSLQNAHSELSVAQTRLIQEKERTSAAEHRLKQLQEELKCQRQNAESIRLQQQQRTKEQEKQHQRDLAELQKERQFLEKQHQQEVNKLNQELQQARTLHNALQAQFDKLLLQKQMLDKEFDSLKAKLKWTEDELKESQKKETQLQAKLTEVVHEVESVTVSLEQSRKRERTLEEEGKRLAEERLDALRQVKELQEQKSSLAISSQPVQFCPVGQGFSSPSSVPHPPRPPTKRPDFQQTRADDEQTAYERRAQQPNLYSDREPGEGIDSEHIAVTSPADSENKSRNEAMKSDIHGTNRSFSSFSSTITGNVHRGTDSDNPYLLQTMRLSSEKAPLLSEQSVLSPDLKKENDMLRSELQDVREELQKRLQDLEAQRRAEAEARTRLKQLSRKHANHSTVKEEKSKELSAQLESERAETERLKKLVTALEVEFKKRKESNIAEEDRENEMIELNIQLKKQLAEVKAQLALEQEERKQEEEEKNQKCISNTDVKEELSSKVAELTAEVEELRRRIKESQEEESLSADNSPLKYLNLHNDELNSNMVCPEHKLLLFCQSTNERNMLVSAGENFEKEESMIDLDPSLLSDEDETDQLTSNLDDFSLSELSTSDTSEVQHLKKECERQTERAAQSQVKLEALQRQVTRQTQQLTTAFEKQSMHIAGLLAELQEKERSHEEELLQCKKELEAAKSANHCNHIHHALKSLDNTNLNPTVTANHPESDKQDIECSSDLGKGLGFSELVNSTVGNVQHCQIRGRDNLVQQKDQVLNEKPAETSVLGSENKPQSLIQTQTPKSSVELCVQEHETQKQQEKLTCEKQESLSSVKSSGDKIYIFERTDEISRGAEEDQVQTSQADVNHLQQQVVALQMKIKALSEEVQQQAEELVLWKLSSQPAPTFNMLELQTDPDKMIQSQAQAQTHTLAPLCRQDNITVIREDQLLLSCSSRKLQGRLFCSRLEPKNLHPSETVTLQEFIQDTANNNQESKNENQKEEAFHQLAASSTQLKGKTDTELIQIPMSKGTQPCVVKDILQDWEATGTKTLASEEASIKEPTDRNVRSISSQTDSLNICAATQTDKEVVESPPLSPVSAPEGAESQQPLLFTGSFPIPADPARLAERIRRNRTQLSAAFDDTEYEPYGLPEVVMKGFADIPSGPSCPYIVRRGLLGTTVVPGLEKEEETD